MRKGILGAGNWLIDKVKTIDRWPGEGNLCNIVAETRGGGGGPCNVLFDIAAIDPSVPLYAAGRVGNDADGEWLLNEIRRRGIDDRCMVRTGTASTSYTDVMSGAGKRTFFHCRGANAEFCAEDVAAVDVPAKYFYLGYLLLLDKLDAPDAEYGTGGARLLSDMTAKGYETVVDFVSEAPEKFRRVITPALKHIDDLIINEVEAASFYGKEIRREDGSIDYAALVPAAEAFLAGGVRKLVVIHFPEGALGLEKGGKPIYAPSCKVALSEIVGSTGAGDAYAAGVLYALHQGMDLRQAMNVGCASSRFNLLDATATGGAVSYATMQHFLSTCSFNEIPEIFK